MGAILKGLMNEKILPQRQSGALLLATPCWNLEACTKSSCGVLTTKAGLNSIPFITFLSDKVDADFLAMIKEAEDDESKGAEGAPLDVDPTDDK